jgi:hypothetical protein
MENSSSTMDYIFGPLGAEYCNYFYLAYFVNRLFYTMCMNSNDV